MKIYLSLKNKMLFYDLVANLCHQMPSGMNGRQIFDASSSNFIGVINVLKLLLNLQEMKKTYT